MAILMPFAQEPTLSENEPTLGSWAHLVIQGHCSQITTSRSRGPTQTPLFITAQTGHLLATLWAMTWPSPHVAKSPKSSQSVESIAAHTNAHQALSSRPPGAARPPGGGRVHTGDASSARTGGASAQSEKRQDGEDDDDETNEIDDVTHGVPFHLGARLTACATSRALMTIACARRAPAVQRPHGLSTAGSPRRGSLTASPHRRGWRAARTRCCCSSGHVS
jgi:hypothetical protein